MTENQQNTVTEYQEDEKNGGSTADGHRGAGKTSRYSYGSTDARRACCTFLVTFLVLAGITALTVWLIYRPHKPKFTLISAAIYDLNTSTPPFISTTMQFTVVTRNPNDRMITPPVMLPPLFHEKDTTVTLSPILGGAGVPVSVEVTNGLLMDEAYGVVGLRLVLLGKLRWKAGAITTAHYGFYVRCDMLIGFKKGFVGQVPLLGSPACHVDI
ncbi:hypothetical protein LguiB_023826 [Lonicera macranthoides]